jgi:predicted RNA-binding Zn-ribbon protein involved in translation (DUF1610 family)
MKPTDAGGVAEEKDRIVTYTCHACGNRGVDPPKSKKGNYTCPECGDQVEISEKRVVKKKVR